MITELSPWSSAEAVPSVGTLEPQDFAPSFPLERRKRSAAEAPAHRADTAEAHQIIVQRVVAHMRAHLDEALTLDELARLASTSKFHLVRIFEEVSGTSPHHFLTCLRLERAKDLLLNSDYSITDVCLEVGYSSHGTFSRTFAFSVGISPTEFRSSGRNAAL